VIAVPAMYFLGREVKGERVGIVAALFTCLNYMHIYYSQELRFYSLTFLLTCLSFLFLIRAYKNEKAISFVLYTTFTTALLYTHYYGLVIYAVQIIIYFVLVFFFAKSSRFIYGSAISGVIVSCLFLPWLPILSSDLGLESFWISRPEATFILDYFYYYFGKDAIVSTLFIFLTCIFIKRLFAKDRIDMAQRSLYVIIALWFFFSYLIPYVKSLVGTPILYVRYTIISLPAWILIFAIGLELIEKVKWRNAILVIACLSMVVNLFFFRKHYSRVQKQQFREVSSLVKSLNHRAYPVYSIYPWHFGYYFRDTGLKPQRLEDGLMPTRDSIWVIQAEFFSPEENQKVVDPLLTEYEIVERYPFHKTEAILLRRVAR
jgi:mannosyltransferase